MAVVLFAESGATMSIRVEIEKKITDLQEIIDAAKTYYMRASKDVNFIMLLVELSIYR